MSARDDAFIDKAEWHLDAAAKSGAPEAGAYTHIGMIAAWIVARDWHDAELRDDPHLLDQLGSRAITPGRFIQAATDGYVGESVVREEAVPFLRAYHGTGLYFDDYAEAAGADASSIFKAADSWETYDKLAPRVDARYRDWQSGTLQAKAGLSRSWSRAAPAVQPRTILLIAAVVALAYLVRGLLG